MPDLFFYRDPEEAEKEEKERAESPADDEDWGLCCPAEGRVGRRGQGRGLGRRRSARRRRCSGCPCRPRSRGCCPCRVSRYRGLGRRHRDQRLGRGQQRRAARRRHHQLGWLQPVVIILNCTFTSCIVTARLPEVWHVGLSVEIKLTNKAFVASKKK